MEIFCYIYILSEQDMFPIIADNMISKPFIDTRDIPQAQALYEVLLQSPRPEVQNNFKWLFEFKFRNVCRNYSCCVMV